MILKTLAAHLSQIISSSEVSSITDEWKLYSVESIPIEWAERKIVVDTGEDQDVPNKTVSSKVDDYWTKLLAMRNFAGNFKYQTLGKVVMASLALSHGNADVERGFLTNKRLIPTDRTTLNSNTINICRLVKDMIRINASSVASVTPALLTRARLAYGKYKEYL